LASSIAISPSSQPFFTGSFASASATGSKRFVQSSALRVSMVTLPPEIRALMR
jgi:hypothetical protein